jgi:2-succinyl-5-enolpyruvyl-6-hydroxy-3-cyclohexene-1-carboxylate synthase
MLWNQHTLDGMTEYVSWQGNAAQLCVIVQIAESLEIAWGCWRQDQKLYGAFGGLVEDYEPENFRQKSHQTNEIKALSNIHLPWLVVARRFDEYDQRSINDAHDPWCGWGTLGSIWQPTFCLYYDEASESGVIAWRRGQNNHALYSTLFSASMTQPTIGVDNQDLDLDDLVTQENWSSWEARVNKVKTLCGQKKLTKAVLARSWLKRAPTNTHWSGAKLWQKLIQIAQDNETPFALSLAPQTCFVGVSPEHLFNLTDGRIVTHALAGTRALSGLESNAELTMVNDELKQSAKDIEEHQIVVDQLSAHLKELCHSIEIEPLNTKQLRQLVHLETLITGTLHDDVDPFSLLERLHPTPALGGAPREAALSLIRECEPLSRGGYAAPWMWSDQNGRASAVVGIRSALLHKDQAFIYAGAGIVEQSLADNEWAETRAKADVMGSLLTKDILSLRVPPDQSIRESLPQSSLLRCLNVVEELSLLGLRGAVISPGSRNTPIALALNNCVPTHICVDERSAGFIALGWAKSSASLIALCCTSGSAGAHYLPALVEAKYSAVPLLVLTADRPPRLRGRGAPQTIEQMGLFGSYVKASAELMIEDKWVSAHKRKALNDLWCERVCSVTSQSMIEPRGAVHVNLPFEEPLWDEGCDQILTKYQPPSKYAEIDTQVGDVVNKPPSKQAVEFEVTRHFMQGAISTKGIIYCGPLSPKAADRLLPTLSLFSEVSGWPILAEASSQLRSHKSMLAYFDVYTRTMTEWGTDIDPPLATECQAVLMVGGTTHSRSIRTWFDQVIDASWFWLGEGPELVDPECRGMIALGDSLGGALEVIHQVLSRLSPSADRSWLQRWQRLELYFTEQAKIDRSLMWGGLVGQVISQVLDGQRDRDDDKNQCSDLVIANSMAFRDHDMTWHPRKQSGLAPTARCWVNRGANGIDGTLSSALGIALGTRSERPLLIWIGDLATYHDLQGLYGLAQWSYEKHTRPIVVLVSNNGGGGIFKHLPIREGTQFTRLFQTPLHTHDPVFDRSWCDVARWLRVDQFVKTESTEVLVETLETAVTQPILTMIEVVIDGDIDYQKHQEYWTSFQWSSQPIGGKR